MRETVEIITCDVCRRNLADVNSPKLSGSGYLKITSSLGSEGGGASSSIVFNDLCCECTLELNHIINEFKKKNA